jgi:transposase-like protein
MPPNCKARVNRRVVAQAVVVATGVCGDGRREVLGFSVGDSEDGAFWTAFLRSLKARGLGGVQLVIADAHLGLRQAVQATMAGAAIQRCRVHFLRNVLALVGRDPDKRSYLTLLEPSDAPVGASFILGPDRPRPGSARREPRHAGDDDDQGGCGSGRNAE